MIASLPFVFGLSAKTLISEGLAANIIRHKNAFILAYAANAAPRIPRNAASLRPIAGKIFLFAMSTRVIAAISQFLRSVFRLAALVSATKLSL